MTGFLVLVPEKGLVGEVAVHLLLGLAINTIY
jgi:hypothetical protein